MKGSKVELYLGYHNEKDFGCWLLVGNLVRMCWNITKVVIYVNEHVV
jgi:hypothetical protein